MSDSLFMQQQEAAAMNKESKRALEERTALEAFRAAALQVGWSRRQPVQFCRFVFVGMEG